MELFSLGAEWELGKELNGNTPFKCYVAYSDLNRKNIDIPKEVFTKAFPTAIGIPVVAHFFSDGQEGGHEGDMAKVGFELRKTGKTYAYGVTRYDKLPYWETRNDGKEWVCMEGYIFTRRFPESRQILKSSQSMEVNLSFSDVSKDIKYVDGLEFLALCSLNPKAVEATFEGSKFVSFSEQEYYDAYEKGDIAAYYKHMKEMFNDEEFEMKPSDKIKYPKLENTEDLKEWLRAIAVDFSDEEIAELEEDFNFAIPEKYKDINFIPPASVAKQAKQGLELREKQPDSNKCCTPTGLARARQLVNRQQLSPSTVKRMKSFFDRHEVDKQGEGWGVDSKGYQAWKIWGSDAGYSWAKKIVAQMEKADENFSSQGFSDEVKVVTDGDKAIEGNVGEKDTGELKRKAMEASNRASIIPKIFARHPSEIDDSLTQADLGYPLMSLRDGVFYYNTGFIKAASSRIEQNKNEPYYNEVRKNIVKARKEVGMSEEFSEEVTYTMNPEIMKKMGMDMYTKYGMKYMPYAMDEKYVYAMDTEKDMAKMRMPYELKDEEYACNYDLMESLDMDEKEMAIKTVMGMLKEHLDMMRQHEMDSFAKEKEEMMSTFAMEKKEMEDKIKEKEEEAEKFAKEKKEMEFAKALDSEDFAMLTEEDKMSLMKNTDMAMEDFVIKAESMAYKRAKETGMIKAKEKEGFSIGLPHNDGGVAVEEPKTTFEKIQQYIGK